MSIYDTVNGAYVSYWLFQTRRKKEAKNSGPRTNIRSSLKIRKTCFQSIHVSGKISFARSLRKKTREKFNWTENFQRPASFESFQSLGPSANFDITLSFPFGEESRTLTLAPISPNEKFRAFSAVIALFDSATSRWADKNS